MKLLIAFLSWGIMNIIYRIFIQADHSTDIAILRHYDLAWLGFSIAAALLILNILSLYAVLEKKRWGINVVSLFCGLNVVFTLLVMTISFMNPELFKDAYLESRMSRGLSPLDSEKIELVTNPWMIAAMGGGYALFYAILILYIRSKETYFSSK